MSNTSKRTQSLWQVKPIASAAAVLGMVVIAGCSQNSSQPADAASGDDLGALQRPTGAVLFDDFNYASFDAFAANGWKARTETGHPGVAGATWSADGVSFLAASSGADTSSKPAADNRMMRLTSFTDGSADNTQHVQVCHSRKFLHGTYAARVFFRDQPTKGPDGDGVIQTFYAISPLDAPMDPNYSEMDFEYLPNGGWEDFLAPGDWKKGENALWSTTWETFQLEPWTKVNEHSTVFTKDVGNLNGWHTLVLNSDGNTVRYFVDGHLLGEHSSNVAPEHPMSMNFNQWFTPEGPIDSTAMRQYDEDVDWVYHEVNNILDTDQVNAKVAALRANKVSFSDNIPEWSPVLPSPCGL